MDLSFTPQELAFQAELRDWLQGNVPAEPLVSMDTPEGFKQHREWERKLFEGGWAVPAWPEKYGGRDCSLVEWLLYEEEYWASGAPGRVSANGVSLLAPTIFGFATPAQQDRFLRPMASGEEIWSQAWSEPNAGSDLAALATRAERDGDWYVLNGQKTWCSRGAFADWYFCLVRTDPAAERHRGLSYLLIPKDTEGMTVREVARIDKEPGFAELFFEDAKVHVSNLLGEEGQGWAVAMATTGSERGLNLRAPGRFMAGADRLVRLARELGAASGSASPDSVPAPDPSYSGSLSTSGAVSAPAPDPPGTNSLVAPGSASVPYSARASALSSASVSLSAREDLARCWAQSRAYRWLCYEAAEKLSGGGDLGAEASFMKIFWSELDVDIHAVALSLLGERGELTSSAPDAAAGGAWMDGYLFALSGPIYAGTNEIQRNIVAERVLGLPRR